MPDFEDAFRRALRWIDTIDPPVPPLDVAALVERAAAAQARRPGDSAEVSAASNGAGIAEEAERGRPSGSVRSLLAAGSAEDASDEDAAGTPEGRQARPGAESPVLRPDLSALAEASAARDRRSARTAMVRLLAAAAAVILVAGAAIGAWLNLRPDGGPILAEPEPTPPSAPLVIAPLSGTPSPHEVLVDDPGLIDHEIAGEGGVPTRFFAGSDTITVDDAARDRLAVYRGGEVVDSVAAPLDDWYESFVLWDDVYYFVGDTLRAYRRQGGELVKTDLPDSIAGVREVSELVVEGPNLVAQTASGERYLVAGPGGLAPAPDLEIVGDGFTVRDGKINAHLKTTWEPSGIEVLGRESNRVWYLASSSRSFQRAGHWSQGFVYQFSTDGELIGTLALDLGVNLNSVRVANGRVYALVVKKDSARLRDDTVQIWELTPSPAVYAQSDTGPADECDLALLGVDPIACTTPEATTPPIPQLLGDLDYYVLSAADGKIRCDISGPDEFVACVSQVSLEPTDPADCGSQRFDQDYVSLRRDEEGHWMSGGGGCRSGRLIAEQATSPTLPEGKLLTVGDFAVLATPDGVLVWNGPADRGFEIYGERVKSW